MKRTFSEEAVLLESERASLGEEKKAKRRLRIITGLHEIDFSHVKETSLTCSLVIN